MRNWEYLRTFNDPCSAYMYHLVGLHHDIVWYLIIILIIVLWSIYTLVRDYGFNNNLLLEIIRNNRTILFIETYVVFFIFNFFFFILHISFEVADAYKRNDSFIANIIIKGIHYFCIYIFGLQGNSYYTEDMDLYRTSRSIYVKNYNRTYSNSDADFYLRSLDDFMYWNIFWMHIEYLMRTKYTSRSLGHNHLTNHFYNGIIFAPKRMIIQSRLHWFYFKTEYAYLVAGSPIIFVALTKRDTYIQLSRSAGFLKLLSFKHSWVFEMIWAGGPSYIVGTILSPSLSLIYANDVGSLTSQFFVKVIGSQWFWDYELTNWHPALLAQKVNEDWLDLEEFIRSGYKGCNKFKLHSIFLCRYLDSLEGEIYNNWRTDAKFLELNVHADLVQNDEPRKRLLETTSTLVLPTNVPITFFVTATDVLHSWAVPNLGLKIDAVPGRLNEITTVITSPGLYTGQCSELCGVGHGFMPIRILAVSPDEFTIYTELSVMHDHLKSSNTK